MIEKSDASGWTILCYCVCVGAQCIFAIYSIGYVKVRDFDIFLDLFDGIETVASQN